MSSMARDLSRDLFVGPAVVVDDEAYQEDTAVHVVIEELKEANFPVLRRHVIPPDDEVAHWQAMSLIVLDWNLLGTNIVPNRDDSEENDGSALLGVDLPDSARRDPKTDSLRFVKKLLQDLYCPIFIISNFGVEAIWKRLEEGLDGDETQQLRARVLVRSKTQVQGSLLEELGEWISKHPAIYALKTWERGYERAMVELFHDFQQSAVGWPGILWRNSHRDGVNPNYNLTETITRNLLHRMDPRLFSDQMISSTADHQSLDSVRRVLHQHAILPVERLHDDVIMPGDFFVLEDADDEDAEEEQEDEEDAKHEQKCLPEIIDICLTPACDLVARSQDADSVRMFMVQALLVRDDELRTRRALDHMLDLSDSTMSVLLHHLVPQDAMYIVRFKNWSVKTWGEIKDRRRGRLLDPYVTLLQQRYALFSQRQGLPRLPEGFYEPRPVPDPSTSASDN